MGRVRDKIYRQQIGGYFWFRNCITTDERLTARALLVQADGVSINHRHICLLDLVLLDHSECLGDQHIPLL